MRALRSSAPDHHLAHLTPESLGAPNRRSLYHSRMSIALELSAAAVSAAADRLRTIARRTPLERSDRLSEDLSASVWQVSVRAQDSAGHLGPWSAWGTSTVS